MGKRRDVEGKRAGHGRARIGRFGAYGVPIFALAVVGAPHSQAAFSTDPAVYQRYAASVRYAMSGAGLAVLGGLAIVGMAAVLSGGRGRGLARVGLVFGLIGALAMVFEPHTLIIRGERLRHSLLSADFRQLEVNAHVTDARVAAVVLAGAAMVTVAWMVFGIAVILTRGMNKTDGLLLIVSAPMIYGGGMILGMLPTLGAFLLLAAGLGISLTAGRAGTPARNSVTAPRHERATGLAIFVDRDNSDGPSPPPSRVRESGVRTVPASPAGAPPTSWSVSRGGLVPDGAAPAPHPGAKNLRQASASGKVGSPNSSTATGRPRGGRANLGGPANRGGGEGKPDGSSGSGLRRE